MATDFSQIKLNVPTWVQEALDRWETKAHYFVAEIAEDLRKVHDSQPDVSEGDFKGYYAEWAAFMFHDAPSGKSMWNTYFGPMAVFGGTASPDVKLLDREIVERWEQRALSVKSSIMRARYADLVWDMKQIVTGSRPSHQFAEIAVNAYAQSADENTYKMAIEAVTWLKRAFELSLTLKREDLAKKIVGSVFKFYDVAATPRLVGVWIFPFDLLFEHRELLTRDQYARLIDDLEKMLWLTSGNGKAEEFDPHGAEAAAERLVRYYRRQKDKPNVERSIKAYAGAFQKASEQAGGLLATAWLQPVIERLQQEGLKAEAEELQLLSAKKGEGIRSELKRVEVKTEIDPKKIDELIEKLIAGDLQTALARIGAYYVPRAESAKSLLERLKTDAPFLSMMEMIVVNEDGHPAARIGSLDEDPEGRLHKQLHEMMGFAQPFLMQTIAKVKERYSPTVEQIIEFLRLSPLFSSDEGPLLRVGLEAYWTEDFVKAIHILVPQVEHILRNFLNLLGIPTLKTVRNLGIMDAKGMNDILSDERMRQVLTENLWRYLTVIYIDKRGMNLRNDLAHGLLRLDMFNRAVADRVFHTLLALSLLRLKN